MRAAVVDRYGAPDVVRVAEVVRPEPRAGEVLVRVESAAVTSADSRIRAARFPAGFAVFARLAFGIRRPPSQSPRQCLLRGGRGRRLAGQ